MGCWATSAGRWRRRCTVTSSVYGFETLLAKVGSSPYRRLTLPTLEVRHSPARKPGRLLTGGMAAARVGWETSRCRLWK